jgi:hypothetical protein
MSVVHDLVFEVQKLQLQFERLAAVHPWITVDIPSIVDMSRFPVIGEINSETDKVGIPHDPERVLVIENCEALSARAEYLLNRALTECQLPMSLDTWVGIIKQKEKSRKRYGWLTWIGESKPGWPNRIINYAQAAADGLKSLWQHIQAVAVVDHKNESPKGNANAQVFESTKPKQNTRRGEARAKIVATLTAHHKYADGSALNLEPIGVNELAMKAEVGSASVSRFFHKAFGSKSAPDGLANYRRACANLMTLITALKTLNGEFAPSMLFEKTDHLAGRRDQNDDE